MLFATTQFVLDAKESERRRLNKKKTRKKAAKKKVGSRQVCSNEPKRLSAKKAFVVFFYVFINMKISLAINQMTMAYTNSGTSSNPKLKQF